MSASEKSVVGNVNIGVHSSRDGMGSDIEIQWFYTQSHMRILSNVAQHSVKSGLSSDLSWHI